MLQLILEKIYIKTPISFDSNLCRWDVDLYHLDEGLQIANTSPNPCSAQKPDTKIGQLFFLPDEYLRSNIFSQKSKWYHAIPENDSLPKMFDNKEVYTLIHSSVKCVCASGRVPGSFHATSHQSDALAGLQHQSMQWLAQFLDFIILSRKDLITILSCWQSLIKRFLPKPTNSLCTRYRLWSRTSVVRKSDTTIGKRSKKHINWYIERFIKLHIFIHICTTIYQQIYQQIDTSNICEKIPKGLKNMSQKIHGTIS